jgi:hypothetical protein
LLGDGTNAVKFVAPGTSGNVLTSNGTTWASATPSAPSALSTASGSAPSYSARAWVNFDGTGTFSPNPSTSAIRASGNVSSITKNGTGYYTVNLTTALADANYCVATGHSLSGTNTSIDGGNIFCSGVQGNNITPTTSSFELAFGQVGTGQRDPLYVAVSVYR